MALGLNPALPPQPAMQAPMLTAPSAPFGVNVGGVMPIMSARALFDMQKRESETAQNQPIIQELAGYVRKCWSKARDAKEQTVERRMLQSVRQRRGEYDPEVLARIRQQGGSEIYMMLTSAKCRGASAWLRDVMLGSGGDKPWTLKPTPLPTLPPQTMQELRDRAINELEMYMKLTGAQPAEPELKQFLIALREEYFNGLYEEARSKTDAMERKMEDQLAEGGFLAAMDEFIDDVTTFPSAVFKGPVVRNKAVLEWTPSTAGNFDLKVADQLVLEWERVDPFMVYPSPSATSPQDGYFIERHKLTPTDLEAMLGVEGYDDGAIRAVLDEYGNGGLQEWLAVDSSKAAAEGKSTTSVVDNPDHLIDALQFWGTVSGKMLLDWGLTEEEVDDPVKQFHCEVWLIGRWVIKATLNYHPLGMKPYFKASYEDIPGSFWGNSVCDLVRDCQDMCNSAARALANNMGIASGPQAVVNVDRVPTGEDITQMYPWKIWQVSADMSGSTQKPVEFFQPSTNSNELMSIYEKFSVLADEYSSIPRYMTGDSPAGGAGRTASGMSMLMNNANKSMKQVVGNIDNSIMTPLLERLYFYNMKYSDDPQLKGDVQIVARGANSVVTKEAAQVRRNEFLTAVATNPVLTQEVGREGIRELLRSTAKTLDMDVDKIVPSPVKTTLLNAMMQAAAGVTPPPPGVEGGGGPAQQQQIGSGQELQDGSPVTDSFQPPKKPNP